MNGFPTSEADRNEEGSCCRPVERSRGGELRSPGQDLQALSRRGTRGLVLFLLASTVFFWIRRVDLLVPLAESLREFLGSPPPPALISMALVGYTLAAVILVLSRVGSGARPTLKWSHLGYRTAFYFFYGLSGSLEEHFMGVFVAGLAVFGLELVNIWSYSLKILPPGRELPGKL